MVKARGGKMKASLDKHSAMVAKALGYTYDQPVEPQVRETTTKATIAILTRPNMAGVIDTRRPRRRIRVGENAEAISRRDGSTFSGIVRMFGEDGSATISRGGVYMTFSPETHEILPV